MTKTLILSLFIVGCSTSPPKETVPLSTFAENYGQAWCSRLQTCYYDDYESLSGGDLETCMSNVASSLDFTPTCSEEEMNDCMGKVAFSECGVDERACDKVCGL